MARLDGERHDDELIRDEVDDEIWILKPNEPRGHAGELEKDLAREPDAHRFFVSLLYARRRKPATASIGTQLRAACAQRARPGTASWGTERGLS